MEQQTNSLEVTPVDKKKVKGILKVTLILFLLTAVEFLIAFTIAGGTLKTTIFILMTIVKAFYIMGEFMHLSHESKGLKWSIIAPLIFIAWMILAFLIQGDAIFTAIFG